MMIFPTPRSFGTQPAGPCTSSEVLRAGATALGIHFEIDAELRVVLDSVPFATLADADAHLDARAIRLGQLLAIQAAKEEEAARLVICQREARIAIEETRESFTPRDVLPEALRF